MCNTNKRTPHKHAALIKAWADGAEIQLRSLDTGNWMDVDKPVWLEYYEYRIKQELTDLEKYGVEVGDVWNSCSDDVVVVQSSQGHSVVSYYTLDNVKLTEDDTLLFRRGVVNKL